MKPRVMYVENKDELNGVGQIGRVSFSKTGRTLYYGGREFRSLKGKGYKANFYDIQTGEAYWISGSKRDGRDRLYGQGGVPIDEDARLEYWTLVRKQPGKAIRSVT